MNPPRKRRSISDIQADYDRGETAELETLMRAWKGIKELPISDSNSFFKLGGFHGEPFRGPGAKTNAWWGGYCQHGTVLFPTWHRVYLHKLEKALQSIPGCETVMLPFWDECSEDSKTKGIPRALTDEKFMLDGVLIDNPLRSFVLPTAIVDNVAEDSGTDPNSPNYSKPAGYETVRYPLSGLVGTEADRATTQAHNAKFPNYAKNVSILDDNIMAWLKLPVVTGGVTRGLVIKKFSDCMDAPTYTLFSNTTSATAWNNANKDQPVVPLESPHNYMHLAVGGFDIPNYDASPITGANGDMGENDTAGLDPIFYFHHCFIDYAFWTWQRRHNATQALTIDSDDPGASYAGNQPPAGANPGDQLSMLTPLVPFQKSDGAYFDSRDCVDIEGQLGYTYGPGSLDHFANAPLATLAVGDTPTTQILVSHIDRTKISGSFIVAVYAEVDGEHRLIGAEPVLSRWNVTGCANCQTKLRVSSSFHVPTASLGDANIKVAIHTRKGVLGDKAPAMVSAGQLRATDSAGEVPFKVEIR
ncbi:tyrosinase family protein [Tabrizicola aquatica]|uniref:tyrosinase family protein n=1 Tax=Tabrizicola aquatica TaxID=909926 RepID=UPI000CD11AEA|nr:tyrosinase family protein [Tabrizicola aquatica]